jgi:hypothetical protein
MKLYTEEQVRQMLEVCILSDKYPDVLTLNDVLKTQTPIKIPSDEDLGDMCKAYIEHINTMVHADLERDGYLNVGFHQGAKWMRDKIQGGNK